MSVVAKLSGPFDKVLKESSMEWAISSKKDGFQPLKVVFHKHDPTAPGKGYHVTLQLDEASSLEEESTSESAKDSESCKTMVSSTAAPSLKLSEVAFASSGLSDIGSMWSDDSFETSLTLLSSNSDSNEEKKTPDGKSVSDKQNADKDLAGEAATPNEVITKLDKGKGKARDDGDDVAAGGDPAIDPRTFQPHYRSLLDDFDDFEVPAPNGKSARPEKKKR